MFKDLEKYVCNCFFCWRDNVIKQFTGGAIPCGQSFVDPSFCEEPEKLLFEFSREIFLEQIQFFKESHNGNYFQS